MLPLPPPVVCYTPLSMLHSATVPQPLIVHHATPSYLCPEVQLPQHGLRPLHLPAAGWVVPPRTIATFASAPASAFACARLCAFAFATTISTTIPTTISTTISTTICDAAAAITRADEAAVAAAAAADLFGSAIVVVVVVVGGGGGGGGRDSEHEGEQGLRIDAPLAQGSEPGCRRGEGGATWADGGGAERRQTAGPCANIGA